jgi:hypothetical protein
VPKNRHAFENYSPPHVAFDVQFQCRHLVALQTVTFAKRGGQLAAVVAATYLCID